MKKVAIAIFISSLFLPLETLAGEQEPQGLAAVTKLGQLNGQVLACSNRKAASQIKALMLTHSPKTSRYGDAFEMATQAGFREQTKKSATCPDQADILGKLDELTKELLTVLPTENRETH